MSKVHWVSIYVTIFMCIFLVSCSSNYHIEKAGTLQDLLKGDTHKIDNLVLSGFINSADFSTMSEMCSFGILKTIDLTECKVVADNKNSANVIPLNAFKDAKELVSIKLPATIKKISSNSFSNCHKLINIDIPKGVTIIDDEAFSYFVLLCKTLRYLMEQRWHTLRLMNRHFRMIVLLKNIIILRIPITN